MDLIYLRCTSEALRPVDTTGVRWLARDADYDLARRLWQTFGQELDRSAWLQAHSDGYRYAGIVRNGALVSVAALWRFSERAWEVAAVGTVPEMRRRGLSRRVVAFVTASILDAGRLATCTTRSGNVAMIATAESVGFFQVAPHAAWWRHPDRPDAGA